MVGVHLDDHDPLLGAVVVAQQPRLGQVGQPGVLEQLLGGEPVHGVTDRMADQVHRDDEIAFSSATT